MIMNTLNAIVIFGIQMRCHQHLIAGKGLFGEGKTDVVCFVIGTDLSGYKGLHILIKINAIRLSIEIFSSHELVICVLTEAVYTAYILPTVLINRLLFLYTIVDAPTHCTWGLFAFFDKNHRCHRLPLAASDNGIRAGVELIDRLIATPDSIYGRR